MHAIEGGGPLERIGMFLVPDFSLIAFAAAVEPLRLANRIAERELYGWWLLSVDGQPVRSSSGIPMPVHASIANPDIDSLRLDSVLVCAGVDGETYSDRKAFAWLRRIARNGVAIGATCTGTFALARAGLLDGYRCTIHWESLPGFAEAFPDIEVMPHLFELDRNRFTASGGTASLDMMLARIAQDHGDELAMQVSAQCMLDRMRPADNDPRMPIRVRMGGHHPKLVAAIEAMETHLEDPLSTDDLAEAVRLSRRQLERLFRKYLGRTPTQYYLGLRLQRARHLLYQTHMPVLDVALACGFVSGSHFSKCYRQMYGRTPQAERKFSGRVLQKAS